MKKILSIALIAALVVSSVFATTFTGDATVKADFDLQSKAYGIHNATNTKLDWALELEKGEGGSVGEGDVYAEIKGTFDVGYKYTGDDALTASGAVAPKATLKITDANIYVKDVKVGILGAGKSADFAKNFKYKYAGATAAHSEMNLAGALEMSTKHGVTVSYKEYTVGFGLEGDADDDKIEMLAYLQAKDVKVADNVTVKAAAAVQDVNGDFAATVNAGATFKDEDLKLTVEGATDVAIGSDVAADVYAKATYDAYTVETYVGIADDVELAVKASAKVSDFTITAQAYDLLEEATRQVGGKVAYKKAPIEASVEANYAIKAEVLDATVACKYTADMFTVDAKVATTFAFSADPALTALKPSVTVSSTKVISNATVSLAYEAADFAKTADKINNAGKITAAAKVSF